MKNILLIATYFISYIPIYFSGTTERLWLSVFRGRPKDTRLDFVLLYYGTAINFLILAYCLHYPKGVNAIITRFVLIITGLDFIHLFLYAKQGFALEKLVLAFTLLGYYQLKHKK